MTAAKIQIRQVSKVFKGQGCEVQALEDQPGYSGQ
jgi:hypothetical protein